jgi:hypothetical protein
MSLLAATWTAAGATVGLFIGAIITAVYAIKAFRNQSDEVRLLQEQAKRDIEQRRRAQAGQVNISVEPRPGVHSEDVRQAAYIRNTSAQPVYDIVLGLGGNSSDLVSEQTSPAASVRSGPRSATPPASDGARPVTANSPNTPAYRARRQRYPPRNEMIETACRPAP